MKNVDRILTVIVAVELLVAGLWIRANWPQPAPPLPNYERLDPVTAAAFRDLRDRLEGNAPDDWLELAEAWIATGYFAEAEACYRQAARLESDSFDILFGWGVALERLGRTGEAIERFHAAIPSASPSIVNVCWYHIGRCHLREENVAEAEAAFGRARDFGPAAYQRAKIRIRSGRAHEAVPLLDEHLQQAPAVLQLVQLRAYASRELGRPDEAEYRDRIERANETMQLDDTSVFLNSLRFRHGLARQVLECQQQRNTAGPQAGAACYSALVSSMNFWDARRALPMLAELQIEIGRPQEAVILLQQLFEHSNETPQTLEFLGNALFALERQDEARRVWERTAAMRDGVTVHLKLADYHERRENTQASRKHTALALHSAGVDDFRNNQLDRALQAFTEAVEFAPDQDHSWFYLGECHRIQGDVVQARAAYERCLAINPAHGRAFVGLNRLPPQSL
jgi:tetratricopeptide (TPR) repeat protein